MASVVAALVFGVITVQFARALVHERELASNPDPAVVTTAATQAQPTPPADDISPEPPPSNPPACPAEDQVRAAMEDLEKFKDPNARATILARTRESVAQSWKPIAASMKLPVGMLDTLVEVLAEESVSQDQRRLECQIDCLCNLETYWASLRESRRNKLEGFLGVEWIDRYDAYVEATLERVNIQELQNRLPDAARIDDEAAERLAMALSGERGQFVTGMEQGGKRIEIAGYVVKDVEEDKPPRPMGGPFNEMLTEQFHNRQIEVASGMLSEKQLAEFRRLLDERVNGAMLMWGLIPD